MKSRQDAWTEEDDLLLAETVLRHVREGSTQLNAFEEVGDKLNRTSAACGFRWNAVVRHQYEKALSLAKKQRKQRQRLLGKDQGGKKKLLYQPPSPSYDEIDAMSLSMSTEMDEEKEEYTSPVMESLEMMEASEAADTEFAEEALEKKEVSSPSVSAPPEQAPAAQRIPVQGKVEMSLEKVIAYLQSLAHSNFSSDILKSENQRLKHENAEIRRQNAELEKQIAQLEKNTVTMQEDYETLMQIMNRARKLVLFEDEEGKAPRFKMDRNGNLEKVAE
ncbi:RsfA family transcriptional regulator [Bacillus salacetis]|uniref:RsfA family transcriptional regulator n=1 Tax=Bacillus salacetis TaxID=2315464 RepID=A0A3A1QS32_9BACI|nr:RsfA family transcriptional regulator [Bacillus salacetis]RIW27836.1 RsfA family transcriptional regulator [Bacillus salacetis]